MNHTVPSNEKVAQKPELVNGAKALSGECGSSEQGYEEHLDTGSAEGRLVCGKPLS